MISDISIQFCEYNRSNPDADRIYRPQGSGDYLFLLLKTPMKVYQENGILITGENACILYTPGQMQHYQAVQKFRNSYLHFVAQENLAEYFQLPQNQIFYPQNPEEIEEIIRKLQQEYITRGSHTEAMQSALICQLLVTATRGLEKGQRHNPEEEGLYRDFQALRMEMLRHYEKHWTTEQLCNQINLEKSQFYAYYRQFFHSTPHNDLLQVRLDKAKNLLTNEALPIQQVALSCGFRNMSHFSRYFKQQCGCSPKDWTSSVSPQ